MPNVLHPYVRNNIVASAARTADGNSGAVEVADDLHGGVFIVNVSASAGTSPTLDLAVEISPDEGTTFFTAFRFAQITATGTRRLAVRFAADGTGSEASIPADPTGGALSAGCPITKNIRFRWNIGGTSPSFTFAVHLVGQRLSSGYVFA